MSSTSRRTILAATTGAAASTGFSASVNQPKSVFVTNLVNSETATLQVTLDDGASWMNVSNDDGIIQADETKNSFVVIGPGDFRMSKTVTASASAIYVVG